MPARPKKLSAYAISLVGQSGEYLFPEDHPNLDGAEMKVIEAVSDDKFLTKIVGRCPGYKTGDVFLVNRSEFLTVDQKKRQADY